MEIDTQSMAENNEKAWSVAESKGGDEEEELEDVDDNKNKFEHDIGSDCTSLSLCDCFLGNQGCVKLMDKVRTHDSLVSLDLRGNGIGAEGVRAIADALRITRSLSILSLEWNSIGVEDSGVRALAASLEVNQSLSELDLRNNMIGPEGCRLLASGLARNVTLRMVDLRWNEAGVSGGKAVAQMLESSNRTLLDLRLSGNNAGSKQLEAIDKLLERNRHPDADVLVGQVRLETLSRKYMMMKDSDEIHPKEKPKLATQDTLERIEEDRKVFAERVVGLEIEIKALTDKLKAADIERTQLQQEKEKARMEWSKVSGDLQDKLQEIQVLEKHLETERAARKNAESSVEKFDQVILSQKKELTRLNEKLEQESEARLAAVRTMEREKALRESLEEKLREYQTEKVEFQSQIETNAMEVRDMREAALREKLQTEKQYDESLAKHREQLAEMERKLQHEIRSRVQDATSHREELEQTVRLLKEKHAEEISTKEKDHYQALSQLEVRLRHEMSEQCGSHVLQEQVLREKHKQEIEALEAKHAQETRKKVQQAVEQAVERALRDAVQKAVAEAARDLEAEHKRVLWQREKELEKEANERAQRQIDEVHAEKVMLEKDIVQLRSALVELKAKHESQLSQLRDRMQNAVSDMFKS